MLLLALSVVLALSISALCSLMEATLLSLTPSQVAEISIRHPRLGKIWQQFKQQIDRPISVILIINTAAHTIGATVAGSEFEKQLGDRWIGLFAIVFTFLMLQFTEILPKTLGVRYRQTIATWIGRPLKMLIIVLQPLIAVIRWINHPFQRGEQHNQPSATVEEIAALAGLARLSMEITPHQERIIRGGSRLSHVTVKEIMLPIQQVSVISSTVSLTEAVIAAHLDAHTRYPIAAEGDSRKILGYVNFKEMIYSLRTNPADASLLGIMRPVRYIGQDELAATLLKAFVDDHAHMAIVQDENENAIGLVTLEDLVEELVGELEDEFDRLPRMVHALGGHVWMIGGGVSVADINKTLDISLQHDGQSLSQWLDARMASAPYPGQVYQEQSTKFTVRRVRRGKAFEVSVQKMEGNKLD